MGVGADALEVSAGSFGDWGTGAVGLVSASVVSCVGTAIWIEACMEGSIKTAETRFLSVKTKCVLTN